MVVKAVNPKFDNALNNDLSVEYCHVEEYVPVPPVGGALDTTTGVLPEQMVWSADTVAAVNGFNTVIAITFVVDVAHELTLSSLLKKVVDVKALGW